MFRRQQRSQAESGFVIPLLVIFAGLLVFFLFSLVLSVFRGNKVAAELTAWLDLTCKNTGYNLPPSQEASITFFRDSVNQFLGESWISYATLNTVDFGLGTMPADGIMSDIFDSNGNGRIDSCDVPSAPFDPSLIAGGTDFTALVGGGCNLTSGDCQYHWDICNDAFFRDNFPSTVANNLQDVGMTVFCRATATVDTLLGTKEVEAKAAHWLPLRTIRPTYVSGNPRTTSPTLSIVIDPHISMIEATSAGANGRWHHNFSTAYPNPIESNFSMFQSWTAGGGMSNKKQAFQVPGTMHPYGGLLNAWWGATGYVGAGGPFVFSFPECYGHNAISAAFGLGAVGGGGVTVGNAPFDRDKGTGSGCISPTAAPDWQAQLISSIASPPVLLRNAVATILVEVLKRTPYNLNTEILITNAMHNYGNFGTMPNEYNPPVLAVELGQQLSIPQFQMPAAFHHGGFGGVPGGFAGPPPPPPVPPLGDDPAAFGPWVATGLRGAVNPFGAYLAGGAAILPPAPFAYPQVSAPAPAPVVGAINGMVSEYFMRSLHVWRSFVHRFAYQAYQGAPALIDRWTDLLFNNAAFEPNSFVPRASAFALQRAPGYWGGGAFIDQQLPWGVPGNAPPPCSSGSMGPTDCVDAAELVGALGAAHACPWDGFPMYDLSAVAFTAWNGAGQFVKCQTPAHPTAAGTPPQFPGELVGDNRAALASLITTTNVDRVRAPGIWPLDVIPLVPNPLNLLPAVTVTNINKPMIPQAYMPTPAVDSSVLFIFSQLDPAQLGEGAIIQQYVDQIIDPIVGRKRAFTAIYLPYNDYTADPNMVAWVKTILRDSTVATPTLSRVFVLSPYSSENVDVANNPLYGAAWDGNEAANFEAYWAALFDPASGPKYIVSRVQNMYRAMSTPELKY